MNSIKGKRVAEWVKTVLIALLTASALLLGWQTRLFNDFFSAIPLFGGVAALGRGSVGTGATESGGAALIEAARPLIIVITNEEGDRYGVKYDTLARDIAYDRTSGILREALGFASEALEISEDEWRAALLRPGVYFEYATPVKLSVLDGWLDARIPGTIGEVSLRRVFVAFGGDKSRIYYQNNDNGLFFASDTASSSGKTQELEMYTANGAQFAFETGIGASENAPYILILPGNDYYDVQAAAAGSVEELLDKVFHAMGHSDETYTDYYESDGALVRVGTQFNISADARGRVKYRRTDIYPLNGAEQTLSEGEAIENARIVVADTIGSLESGAEVFFESLEYGGGNTWSVFFGYYIAGGRIHLYEDGYAARIIFTEGSITEIEVKLRSFTLGGEVTRLPSEKLVLAAAGGEFMLCYSDTGAEKLQPAWVLYN